MEMDFVGSIGLMQEKIYGNACDKGFYDTPKNEGTSLALIHSEISEALEALRHGNPPSEKLQGFGNLEEELADAVIRILDFAREKNLPLAEAIIAKHNYNTTRARMHGGKAF